MRVSGRSTSANEVSEGNVDKPGALEQIVSMNEFNAESIKEFNEDNVGGVRMRNHVHEKHSDNGVSHINEFECIIAKHISPISHVSVSGSCG